MCGSGPGLRRHAARADRGGLLGGYGVRLGLPPPGRGASRSGHTMFSRCGLHPQARTVQSGRVHARHPPKIRWPPRGSPGLCLSEPHVARPPLPCSPALPRGPSTEWGQGKGSVRGEGGFLIHGLWAAGRENGLQLLRDVSLVGLWAAEVLVWFREAGACRLDAVCARTADKTACPQGREPRAETAALGPVVCPWLRGPAAAGSLWTCPQHLLLQPGVCSCPSSVVLLSGSVTHGHRGPKHWMEKLEIDDVSVSVVQRSEQRDRISMSTVLSRARLGLCPASPRRGRCLPSAHSVAVSAIRPAAAAWRCLRSHRRYSTSQWPRSAGGGAGNSDSPERSREFFWEA